MRWQAIVFDMDDTLYPEHDYVMSGFRAVADWVSGEFGIPKEDGFTTLKQLYENGVRGNTFNLWLQKYELETLELVKQLVTVYRNHNPTIQPFPAVIPLLKELQNTCMLGVITDGYLTVQQKKFHALSISHFFDCVIYSDTWGRENWKPSHKPYQAAVSQLGTDPEYTVYIGDNPTKDFYGARSSGWHTIWLKQKQGEYSHLQPPDKDYEPHHIVSDWQALHTYLTKHTSTE